MTWLAFGIVEVAHEAVVVPDLGSAVPGGAVTGVVDNDGWWDWGPLGTIIVTGTLDVTTAAPDVVTGKSGVKGLAVTDGLDKTSGGCVVFGVAVTVFAGFVGAGPVGSCVPAGAIAGVLAVSEHAAIIVGNEWTDHADIVQCGVVVMTTDTVHSTGITGAVGVIILQVFDTVDVLFD